MTAPGRLSLIHRNRGAGCSALRVSLVWPGSHAVATTYLRAVTWIAVAQCRNGLSGLLRGGGVGNRYPQPVLRVFHRPVEQPGKLHQDLLRRRSEDHLDDVMFAWPARDEVQAAVPELHDVRFQFESLAQQAGHGPTAPLPVAVDVGAGQLSVVLVGVEPQHPQVNPLGVRIAPVVPDHVVAVTPDTGVDGSTAAFGAGRLSEANLVWLFGGEKWAVRAEQPIRITSGTAVEHRAEYVVAINEDEQLDCPPGGAFGEGDVESQPAGHRTTVWRAVWAELPIYGGAR
jgi:hypothetical protein